jgi:lipopolysaccharide export system permease protein
MNRIDRYLMSRFVFSLAWSLVAFWAIFLVVDLVEHLDKFIDRGAPAGYVALYYLYYSPYILILVIPIAVLLATLFSVGFLSKRNELLAMRAAGVSLLRIAMPLLFLGLVVTAVVTVAGETVYPRMEQRRADLTEQLLSGGSRPSQIIFQNLFAPGLNGRVFYFKSFNAAQRTGTGVTVQTFREGRMTELLEMRNLRYRDSAWVGESGQRRLFETTSDSATHYEAFDRMAFRGWQETPADFVRKRIDPQRTGYFELKAAIQRMRATGGDPTYEETELALKIAFPFLSFLVVLIGFPIAARTKHSGTALNFGIAMMITFTMRVVIEVFRSFGHNGDIPAWVAAWAPDIVCLVAGTLVLLRARK